MIVFLYPFHTLHFPLDYRVVLTFPYVANVG